MLVLTFPIALLCYYFYTGAEYLDCKHFWVALYINRQSSLLLSYVSSNAHNLIDRIYDWWWSDVRRNEY